MQYCLKLNIKLRIALLLVFAVLSQLIFADESAGDNYVVTLSSGQSYEGTLVMQNDDVVIVRTVQGKTFQFPTSDILSVAQSKVVSEKTNKQASGGNFGLRLDLQTGWTMCNEQNGVPFGARIQFGTTNLMQKNIFLGGGIGVDVYHVVKNYVFVPISATISMPLMQTAHAPYLELGAGYGIGVKIRGGFSGNMAIGYMHRFENKKSIMLALFASVQQAKLDVTETIFESNYVYRSQRVLPQVGLRFSTIL